MSAQTPEYLARLATRNAWRSGAFGRGADLDLDQLLAYHDAALAEGLRTRLADTEARLAATEQAMDERTAAIVREALAPCATCDDTGSICVAPPGLGGQNSPHARIVACPDCNDPGGF
jgi:hypothetical protein